MAKREDIQLFLNDFKVKLGIWSIVYLDKRPKNLQTLLDLEITPAQRTDILRALTVIDYSEGPLEEKAYGGRDMLVFGKEVKKQEVYIKVTVGVANKPVLCISFHIAEHKMKYPFKK